MSCANVAFGQAVSVRNCSQSCLTCQRDSKPAPSLLGRRVACTSAPSPFIPAASSRRTSPLSQLHRTKSEETEPRPADRSRCKNIDTHCHLNHVLTRYRCMSYLNEHTTGKRSIEAGISLTTFHSDNRPADDPGVSLFSPPCQYALTTFPASAPSAQRQERPSSSPDRSPSL
jgi:hypothetical protein